ncbi:cation efflux family protein [Jimgerdemannia flammicorona]|uniref:Cation efflux family protein n=2 Tax=Jimgerdemannia flammicorona TaxID=994334 RepID=A0A433DCJ0_9FUNG|nr:cation efflux family protein [Jimgerdemannia flammicorona]RUS23476.1 cation efflux family protein [Jimgerdemannia flammicorona]
MSTITTIAITTGTSHPVDIPLASRPSTPSLRLHHASTTALAPSPSLTSLRVVTLADTQYTPSVHIPPVHCPPVHSPPIYSPETFEDSFYSSNDPLLLEGRKMSETDIKGLRKTQGRRVQNFYREQNELIDAFLGPLNPINDEAEQKRLFKLKMAVYGSVIANICLFCLQLVAAITSGSLSLFATMTNSFMDLLSSGILVVTERVASKENVTKYPTGKSRMETTGIIVFSTIMATLAIQLIIEAIRTLVAGEHISDVDIRSVILICIALGTKVFLFLLCIALKQYAAVKVLVQDHRNDLFINSLGLAAALLSGGIAWWIDPVGAIIVALIILRSWSWTAYEQIQLIVGKSADVAFLQRLTYIALTHHPKVLQVDTARAYHAGQNLFVEVDIVLPADMPLVESHDISEALQMKLETLPNVERAFVHADYESSHRPEHQKSR